METEIAAHFDDTSLFEHYTQDTIGLRLPVGKFLQDLLYRGGSKTGLQIGAGYLLTQFFKLALQVRRVPGQPDIFPVNYHKAAFSQVIHRHLEKLWTDESSQSGSQFLFLNALFQGKSFMISLCLLNDPALNIFISREGHNIRFLTV